MGPIQLRDFIPEDIEAVWSLVQRTIGTSYKPDYGPAEIQFFQDYHPREKILEDAASGHTLVAVRDGIICGTGTLNGEHLRRVFIDPACQGTGIGTLIADELEKRAREAGISRVDLSSALGARRFWEGRGYVITEELFRPSPDGSVVIHYYEMAKTLG